MKRSNSSLIRVLCVVAAAALIAAACGDDGDSTATATTTTAAPVADPDPVEPAADTSDTADDDHDHADDAAADDHDHAEDDAADHSDEPADSSEPEMDMAADDSLAPVKIGLIAQVEELMAFPEVPGAAQAYVDYFNAELGGVNGHPVELEICTAGDSVESHVACAQQFVNADDVHVVVNAGFLANSIASGTILAEAGKANLGLGNDFVDYLTPDLYNFDPGLPGLAQVFFVFASERRGVTTMTLFLADDPAIEPFGPALQAIGEANGIAVNEVIKLGFEPDLTGPISAADTSNEGWMFVLADGAQCIAAANGAATVGYEGHLFGNDLCAGQDVVESGALNGWGVPIVSSLPTIDGGAEIDEIHRVLETYGDNIQTAGLAGWALANTIIARDLLIEAGGTEATDESVMEALRTYSSSDLPGYPDVSCPGPDPWLGACNTSPLMVTVVDGQMTAPDGFTFLDFSQLNFLLEG